MSTGPSLLFDRMCRDIERSRQAKKDKARSADPDVQSVPGKSALDMFIKAAPGVHVVGQKPVDKSQATKNAEPFDNTEDSLRHTISTFSTY